MSSALDDASPFFIDVYNQVVSKSLRGGREQQTINAIQQAVVWAHGLSKFDRDIAQERVKVQDGNIDLAGSLNKFRSIISIHPLTPERNVMPELQEVSISKLPTTCNAGGGWATVGSLVYVELPAGFDSVVVYYHRFPNTNIKIFDSWIARSEGYKNTIISYATAVLKSDAGNRSAGNALFNQAQDSAQQILTDNEHQ